MCSILGMHYFNGGVVSRLDIENVIFSLETFLSRRGPDEQYCVEPAHQICMAGTRLAISCDASLGRMPFINEEIFCCYNGQIFNFRDNIDFEVDSDGEVIIPLYQEFGIGFVNKLDGEFAISLFDGQLDELFLISDFFGSKPLYFSLSDDCIVWASSESAIQRVREAEYCKSVRDPVYKHTFTSQQPYTNFAGIWRVPPGHYLHVTKQGVKLICYNTWSIKTSKPSSLSSLYDAIEKVIYSRLSYEGTLAIPMSGGIDSGLIAFVADRIGVQYEIFSVDKMFSKPTEETDAIYRRLDELRNYSSINLVDVSEAAYLDAISSVFLPGYHDSCRLDSGMIPTHALYKEISSRGLKVAIDGAGGDELFHGYSFRDDFQHIRGWPRNFDECDYYYSVYSTLISYTEKSDRAAGFFSIENRVPFQSRALMDISMTLAPGEVLKWPLRKVYELEVARVGITRTQHSPKFGFSLKNFTKSEMHRHLKSVWETHSGARICSLAEPDPFPFEIG